ncbi:hypothetical protein [Microbulbifer sp. TYP-18]|uniref:hypothetical protein n=1 Tax=Microbulbifer sp. TYP-18 TaxID=3230024 RepID=UPI0034C66FA7
MNEVKSSFIDRIKKIFHLIVEGPFDDRQKATIPSREKYQKKDFINYFDCRSDIPSIVWDKLVKEESIKGFKPCPKDEVSFMFGLADEDLDEFIVSVLNTCNITIPRSSEVENMNPVRTVEDIVVFVSNCSDICD